MQNNDAVNMIRHNHERAQFDLWKMLWDGMPKRRRDLTRLG